MKNQLTETPEQQMFKNFEPEIRKVLKELKVQELDFGDTFIDFLHKGYYFRLEIKQK